MEDSGMLVQSSEDEIDLYNHDFEFDFSYLGNDGIIVDPYYIDAGECGFPDPEPDYSSCLVINEEYFNKKLLKFNSNSVNELLAYFSDEILSDFFKVYRRVITLICIRYVATQENPDWLESCLGVLAEFAQLNNTISSISNIVIQHDFTEVGEDRLKEIIRIFLSNFEFKPLKIDYSLDRSFDHTSGNPFLSIMMSKNAEMQFLSNHDLPLDFFERFCK